MEAIGVDVHQISDFWFLIFDFVNLNDIKSRAVDRLFHAQRFSQILRKSGFARAQIADKADNFSAVKLARNSSCQLFGVS